MHKSLIQSLIAQYPTVGSYSLPFGPRMGISKVFSGTHLLDSVKIEEKTNIIGGLLVYLETELW